MAEVEIRPAISTDIPVVMNLDHSCETTHVWQVENNDVDGKIEITLREIRLPRALRLIYHRDYKSMADSWTKHSLFLVARLGGQICGYLILEEDFTLSSATVTNLVVDRPFRRQGIASAMLISAQAWLSKRGGTRCILEIPAKNHAAVEMAKKLRFAFGGFVDYYFANGEMAVFFVRKF